MKPPELIKRLKAAIKHLLSKKYNHFIKINGAFVVLVGLLKKIEIIVAVVA